MEQEKQIWEHYLPENVYLYNVDYRDVLGESEETRKLIYDVIQRNSFYPLSENVYDWWDHPDCDYIEEMREQIENDGYVWNDDWIDEIREVFWDRDKSDPIRDLLANTGDIEMYYDLCDWYDEAWRLSEDEFESVIDEICKTLQIPSTDEKRRQIIRDLYGNSGVGGALRIYFKCPLDAVVSGEKYDERKDKPDFKTIKFKGEYTVALHDSINGGGWSEDIHLDCEFEFKRENIQYANYGDRYSYYDVYGVHIEADAPTFSMESNESAMAVETSSANEAAAREEEYERVFRAGGCTFGDMKFTRHRDHYYINTFPCGHKCPHCGTFWVD